MDRRLSFLSFWSINDALDLAALCGQLDELKAAGLDGVVFHPRYYPNKPKYMSEAYLNIVSDLILYAKRIDMAFWLYDENGWPSGTAGGEVMAVRPDLKCEWVEYEQLPNGDWGMTFHSKPGVSSFQGEATALFIAITHEAYREGLKPEAFDYVEGFFSDEVGFLDGHGVTLSSGAIPWDDRFESMYRERHGEELRPLLPLLFQDGDGHEQVRIRYWEMLTDALIEGFYEPIEAWCRENGKRFTAHLKAEEHPYFQLSFSGSCFQVLKGVETPAIDALERYPGNHFYPRLLHSVAMQQGREGCLVEAMGGSGWGVTPESFTDYVLWLAGHGIDQFVLHLNQFRLKTQAVQDWPPSMPCHLSWKEAFPSLLASIQEKAEGLPDLSGEPELLIVVPTRGIMASFIPEEARVLNVHDGSGVPDSPSGRINNRLLRLVDDCYAAGVHYELTEERIVELDGRISSGRLHIGSRAYRTIMLADGCVWNDSEFVAELESAGVQVYDHSTWRPPSAQNKAAEHTVIHEGPYVPQQTDWAAEQLGSNQVWIDFREQSDMQLVADLAIEQAASLAGLRILLHDEAGELLVNETKLTMRETGFGYEALIPDSCLSEGNPLRIKVRKRAPDDPCPVGFVRGNFSVDSLSPYQDKDGKQWMTRGGFKLTTARKPESEDLIASGLPFSGAPVRATKELLIDSEIDDGSRIRLTGIHASAVRVRIDEADLGWCWGPDWCVQLGRLRAGSHRLSLELYASTFNVYGPHRHVDGDRHLTSPDQYKGVKNFADGADAPEYTLGEFWHFVKFGIAGTVQIIQPL